MGSKVGLGDVRGLLMDADKRPVLRLLPEMDEVCRGYAIAHLGGDGCSLEDTANQVWTLNAIDWIREQDEISWSLCQDLDSGGFSMMLHEFAMRIAEDSLRDCEEQGGQVFKKSWELLGVKRRWIEGEISDKELDNARDVYRDSYWAANRDVYRAAYWAAKRAANRDVYRVAYWAAHMAADWAAVRKNQVNLLGDMLEDSMGIERGNALVS